MKREKQLKKAFGYDESGMIDFPSKISNVQLSRLIYCKNACSYCFPHGWESRNSTLGNNERTWKRFRKTPWKPQKKA